MAETRPVPETHTAAGAAAEASSHRRARVKIVILSVIMAVLTVGGIALTVFVDRALQAKSDFSGMTAPVFFANDQITGRFTVHIEYLVPDTRAAGLAYEGEAGSGSDAEQVDPAQGGEDGLAPYGTAPDGDPVVAEPHQVLPMKAVSVDMVWDDSWFFRDSTKRNDDLAFACKVVSAAAQAQAADGVSPDDTARFMGDAVSSLGFRSAETFALPAVGEADEAGAGLCTIATKTVLSDSGEERLIVFACVHGAPCGSVSGETAEAAAGKVLEAIDQRIGVRNRDSVALLFCGQGASGEIAGAAANAADDLALAGTPIAPMKNIFAYLSCGAEKPSDEAAAGYEGRSDAAGHDAETKKAGNESPAFRTFIYGNIFDDRTLAD